MRLRTPGVLAVPGNLPGLLSERRRLERELGATRMPRARRLLAIERRRVVVRLDAAGEAAQATRETGS